MTRSAIVIPVFKGMPHLATCLESLTWVRERQDVDVVVVDCGSTDGSREYVRSRHPWVHSVPGDPSMWWSAATNRGCRYAVEQLKTDALGLLNHDCTWAAGEFEALRRCFMATPNAIHCSRVLHPDGRLLLAGGMAARSGKLTMRGWGLARDPGFPAGRVVWCGGKGVLLPVSVWRQLGGFDERSFPHYHADADFCLRAARIGVPTQYCPESTVVNDTTSGGLAVSRDGATLAEVWATLWARKSSVNIQETVRFYVRHRGLGAVTALLHLYYIHLGSSAVRLARRWRTAVSGRGEGRRSAASGADWHAKPLPMPARGEPSAGRLRVLMVTDLWPVQEDPGRGAFIRCASLALAHRGHDVRVLLLRRWFPPRRLFVALLRPGTLGAVVRAWLREWCRSHAIVPPPVVTVEYTSPPHRLSHDRWGHWAVAIAGGALLRRAKAMQPDVVHGHWATPSGLVAVWLARRLGVCSVVSVHGADVAYTATFRRRGGRSVRSVLAQADAVIVNSSLTARAVRDVAEENLGVHLLWQAGDIVRQRDGRPGTIPRVLSVGHLIPAKGHQESARALAQCRARGAQFSWTVVGHGSIQQERDFRQVLQSHGLADVTRTVRDLTNEEVLAEMARADVFLLLTRKDAYGVVYAEALGAGLAVVGSTMAGAMIDFREAGAPVAVVDPDDQTAATDALCELLMEPRRLEDTKARSQAWAAKNLGWDRHAEQLEAVYRSLSSRRGDSWQRDVHAPCQVRTVS